jgi:hypothetical protein
MRLLLIIMLLPIISIGQFDTTKFYRSPNVGEIFRRAKINALMLPSDTTTNKVGIAQIGGVLYAFGIGKWNAIGSADTTILASKNWANARFLDGKGSDTLNHIVINGYGDTTTGFGGNTGIRINRTNSINASSRGFQDSTKISATVDNTGYAAFDARPRILGTRNYDHIVAMQMNPQHASSGTINELFGSFAYLVQNAGTVNNAYSHYIANPVRSSGTMLRNYGIFIEPQTSATSNWGIYNRAKTYLEDSVRIITALDAGASSPALKIQGTYPLELRTSFATGIEAYSHSNTSHRGFTENYYRSRGTETAPTSAVVGDKVYDVYYFIRKSNAYTSVVSTAINVRDTTNPQADYVLNVNGASSTSQMRVNGLGFSFRNSLTSAISDASATLHLMGSNGAVGTAALKINTGVTTVAESNAIENNGVNLTYTNSLGFRRIIPLANTALFAGSMPFNGAGNNLSSDATNFSYDSANIRLGLRTNAPTHTATFGTGGNGLAIYSTADQTNNFSRLNLNYSSGTAIYDLQRGGTGTVGFHSFRVAGTAVLEVDASNALLGGGILTTSDNSRDIGRLSVSPLRFRSMYLGTSLQVGAAANTTIAATIHAVGAGNTSATFAARFQQNNTTDILTVRNDGRVGVGTSSPTSVLQVVGLPIHADNAAALTAGLTVGAFYHNGDGVVRVVF